LTRRRRARSRQLRRHRSARQRADHGDTFGLDILLSGFEAASNRLPQGTF